MLTETGEKQGSPSSTFFFLKELLIGSFRISSLEFVFLFFPKTEHPQRRGEWGYFFLVLVSVLSAVFCKLLRELYAGFLPSDFLSRWGVTCENRMKEKKVFLSSSNRNRTKQGSCSVFRSSSVLRKKNGFFWALLLFWTVEKQEKRVCSSGFLH